MGTFRRFRPNGPGLGHAFTNYDEFAELPNHELEHLGEDTDLAGVAADVYSRAREPASVGRWEDEAAPDKGHGWMVRLVDASALGAAGFHRVRKVDL